MSEPVRTRFWWVRHAPVRDDRGCIYGQADLDADVSDRVVFEALARVLPPGAVWVTSHLRRTMETAAAIRDAGYEAIGDAAALPDLAEQELGAWQGLDRVAFFRDRPQAPGSYWFGPADERAPGGESFSDVFARVRRAVDHLLAAHPGRDVVAVAHGGSIRAALAVALGVTPDQALAFGIENCSVTRLDHLAGPGGAGWRAVTVNFQPWAGLARGPVPTQPAGPEVARSGAAAPIPNA